MEGGQRSHGMYFGVVLLINSCARRQKVNSEFTSCNLMKKWVE